MKALVTGATGFVGSNLVERLKENKWHVRCLVRRNSKSEKLKTKGIEIVYGDLLDYSSLEKATKGVDVVFNLAAVLPNHNLKPKEYENVNVKGVENIALASFKNKVKRLVHVSTVGIFGQKTIYSQTKSRGEKVIKKYAKKGLKTVIIRPTIAYGPNDTRPGFLNLLKLFRRNLFIKIHNGENFFHTIYIDNLIDALILGATVKKAIGEELIIGDEPVPTMNDIISAMEKATKTKRLPFYIPLSLAYSIGKIFDILKHAGIPAPLSSQRVRFMTQDLKFDIVRSKKVLGWKPKISLEKGIKKTYEWYIQKGYIK